VNDATTVANRPSFWPLLRDYLWAVAKYWYAIVIGIVLTWIDFFERSLGTWWIFRPWVRVVTVALGFAVAQFLAYRDLHSATSPEERPKPIAQSASLGRLRVYRQDLEINLLSVVVGTAVVGNAAVFLQLKLWARAPLNILTMTVQVATGDETYQSTILTSLSNWLLVEDVIDTHKRMTHKDTNLETRSLLREIEGGIFREGHHEPRWIGCEVPVPFLRPEDLKLITILVQDKHGAVKRETYREWPSSDLHVIDAAFRQNS
jgi:hypothetical protein